MVGITRRTSFMNSSVGGTSGTPLRTRQRPVAITEICCAAMYYGHTYVRRRDMDVGTLGGAHELPTHSTGTGTSTCHVYHVYMYVCMLYVPYVLCVLGKL